MATLREGERADEDGGGGEGDGSGERELCGTHSLGIPLEHDTLKRVDKVAARALLLPLLPSRLIPRASHPGGLKRPTSAKQEGETSPPHFDIKDSTARTAKTMLFDITKRAV